MMSTPAPYTISGTGFNIEIIWDSSVASAPAGFTADVEQVANSAASAFAFQSATPITYKIDVGYGEINGSPIGGSVLGESETNLQQVTYSQLTSAYAATGLINNFPSSPPNGRFYVSDAQAQALGIPITNPPTVDGYVGFSSQSGIFDYNTSSGIVPSNQYDFVATVAHEFSEVAGRIFLSGNSYSAYDFFHYSGPGVHDFAANGGGYFSTDGGNTDLANFNKARGGDGADWDAGGTSISGGSAFDAFDAFGTPGQIAPVSHTDLLVLQALGFQGNSTTVATTQSTSGLTNTQTTVQNSVGSSPSSPGLDHAVALFSQYMAAGFSDQPQNGVVNTNPLSQVTTNEHQFLANPHHG
jgi:hypothetical protein